MIHPTSALEDKSLITARTQFEAGVYPSVAAIPCTASIERRNNAVANYWLNRRCCETRHYVDPVTGHLAYKFFLKTPEKHELILQVYNLLRDATPLRLKQYLETVGFYVDKKRACSPEKVISAATKASASGTSALHIIGVRPM